QPKKEGRYSRRINHQHRVVYKVNEELKKVEIYSAWSHYE
ncbi:type II toxin-antitoxin system YoeB family toxin, partial [Pseudolactococcus laudensis]